jgi:hypothetical protein
MARYTVTTADECAPKAGVLSIVDGADIYHRDTVSVARRAEKMNTQPPSKRMIQDALMRCSSEVCGLRQAEAAFQKKLLRLAEGELVLPVVERLSTETLALIARSAGALDLLEDHEANLDQRAAELAFCVDGVTPEEWAAITDRQRWLDAARKHLEAAYVEIGGWPVASLIL